MIRVELSRTAPGVLLALVLLGFACGARAELGNIVCPVMKDPVDASIFAEYKGKKVYFCCDTCRSAFLKDPEKYVVGLPQFAGTSAGRVAPAPQETRAGGLRAGRFIEPMGVLTLSLVALTVFLGVMRRLRPRPLLTIHKICGVCALVSGATHAILVLIAHSH